MSNNNSSTFSTDNFQLASYLLAEGCKLVSTDKSNSRRVLFIFEESDKRNSLTGQFLSHQAKVEPHKFFSAQKDLKQIIYQNK